MNFSMSLVTEFVHWFLLDHRNKCLHIESERENIGHK